MSLKEYHRKRHFKETPEPAGDSTDDTVSIQSKKSAASKATRQSSRLQFVIQKHAATRLHYDFRLEHDGVLKSWAVPHGPSLDPAVKSLAVQVEDHPLAYATFEGTIPKGQYGGGTVMVWDRGTWESDDEDVASALERGKISFRLHGEKLQGAWTLVRMRGRGSESWLLIKKSDEFAQTMQKKDVLSELPRSVLTHRDLSEIADGEPPRVSKNRKKTPKQTTSAEPTAAKTVVRLKSAPQTDMPEQLQPQLATLAKSIPRGDEWLHEIKLDGYRMLARIDEGEVRLLTRSGLDWTDRFPIIARSLSNLNVQRAWLDGEIVAEDERGISSFQKLQNALSANRAESLIYYLFDLVWAEGYDLSQLSLVERKQILKELLEEPRPKSQTKTTKRTSNVIRFHDHIAGTGADVLSSACELRLEGIVSKRRDSTYEFRRTDSWLKVKCRHEQEFVVAGYTKPSGHRTGLGALVLGFYQADRLVYCGRVGTGFSDKSLHDLAKRLKPLETQDSPFAVKPTGAQLRGVKWLKPELVAQVSFANRTAEGILRHAVFHGIREDKLATAVSLEHPKPVKETVIDKRKPPKPKRAVQAAKLSHPDRVVYDDAKLTKADLAQYLNDISDWLLPGLVGRPLTLLRCPHGIEEKCFYQKHFDGELPEGLSSVTIEEKEATNAYPVLQNLQGLMALAQLNTIEFHPWPARAADVERPDRVIFDLDPGEGTTWTAVIDGAREIREMLQQVELESFVRTSGGKGLHVVVPIEAGSVSWEELKEFAKLLSQTMAKHSPKRYVATLSKAARRGKVFVDYLRNQRGATAVASYSPRARSSAGVAMPLRWEDLNAELLSDHFTIQNAVKHVKKRRIDPWKGFATLKQSLPTADQLK